MEPSLALVKDCCTLARQAGDKIMAFYRKHGDVAVKADASPLTAADSASHEFLVAALPSLLPDVPVISEESHDAAAANTALTGRFWLVDPLDGTKEFVKGTDEFTVNIALIEAGVPVLGVVYAPALGLTYFAARGVGAFRQMGHESATAIATRRADTAKLCVVASKDHAGPLVKAMLERMPGATFQSMGSSLKFCLVAEGKADVYLRDVPTMEWDTAAAQCVVTVAGGAIHELTGAPLRYGKATLRNSSIITVGDLGFPWKDYVVAEATVAAH